MLKTLIMKATVIAIVGSISFAAHAIADTQRIDVPAGTLIAALETLAKQADVDIVYQDEQLKGLQTAGVRGDLSPRDAVMKLLEGTPLQLRTDAASGALLITRLPSGGVGSSAATSSASSQSSAEASSETSESRQSSSSPSKGEGRNDQSAGDQNVENSAQPKKGPELEEIVEEIVVTGTHIRGVAPAGQKIITLDRRQIEESGFSTAQDLLRALPQNFIGDVTEGLRSTGGHQASAAATSRQSALNLRGAGIDATLVLVDGRRMAPGGGRAVITDVSSIPLAAVERIEILPDGASALYGSDAIGGVVNFIMRKNYDGAESRIHYGGVVDGGQRELRLSQLLGQAWEESSWFLSLDYFDRGLLQVNERDRGSGDLRPFGGTDLRIANCNPGTLTAGGTSYAIPAGQDGSQLDLASLTPGTRNLCSRLADAVLFPDEKQWNAIARFTHQVTDRISISLDAQYNERDTYSTSPNNSTTLSVPATNAFYPTGATGTVRVGYDFTRDFGPVRTVSDSNTWSATLGVDWSFGQSWKLAAYTGPARNHEHQFANALPDPAGLAQVLADGNAATAFNPFGDGSHTNPATLALLRDSSTSDFLVDSRFWLSGLLVSGELFSLPSGEVRVAIGLDRRDQTFDSTFTSIRRIANTVTRTPTSLERDVSAAFAELFVPIIGGDIGYPGLRRLEVSLAGRHERYSDVGSKSVPRIGVTWGPAKGLAFRASWSESFKGPVLADLVEANNFSLIQDLTDPTAPSGSSTTLFLGGGNAGLKPETAESWTVGFDLDPSLIGGVRLSASYFDIDYKDRISGLPSSSLTPDNGPFVIRNPPAALREQICSTTSFSGNFSSSPGDCLTTPIVAVLDSRLQNLAGLRIRGLDIDLGYDVATRLGRIRTGLNLSRIFEYAVAPAETLPPLDVVNTEGDPLKLRARGSVGWNWENFDVVTYINYANSYQDTTVTPARPIDSWTTVDLNLAYAFSQSPALRGTAISMNLRNAFDEDPPFFNGIATSGGYDGANASFQGRFISMDIRKAW